MIWFTQNYAFFLDKVVESCHPRVKSRECGREGGGGGGQRPGGGQGAAGPRQIYTQKCDKPTNKTAVKPRNNGF